MLKNERATYLIPCLNEAATLGRVIEEAKFIFDKDSDRDWEILVADNGSHDGSPEIAQRLGARVLNVPRRGYGAALQAGILAADTDWVVYGDADGTYHPQDAVKLMQRSRLDPLDLVVGNRLAGTVESKAMPFLHRYLGTPVLSWLIRRLNGAPVRDCNSGIRAVRSQAFRRWNVTSHGMEFASELLIKAAREKARIAEVPARLRRGPEGRLPHLATWRDGMRHLLIILANAPQLFWYAGLLLLLPMTFIATVAALFGMQHIYGTIHFFGPHSQALSLLIGFFGCCFLNVAIGLYVQNPVAHRPPRLVRELTELPENFLFWLSVTWGAIITLGCGYIFWQWSAVHYSNFDFMRPTLALLYFTLIPTSILIGVFHAHLQKSISV